jgi:hypothetical protein
MKTLLSITFVLLTLGLTAQVDSIALRLNYTNYCLYKYQKENKIAIAAGVTGSGMLLVASMDALMGINKTNNYWRNQVALAGDDAGRRSRAETSWKNELKQIDNRKEALTIAGGVFILSGAALNFASYRWLKRAYLVTDEWGLTIGVNL